MSLITLLATKLKSKEFLEDTYYRDNFGGLLGKETEEECFRRRDLCDVYEGRTPYEHWTNNDPNLENLEGKDIGYKNVLLELAAEEGRINEVKLILENGANRYFGAIHTAANNGHIDIVKLLEEREGEGYRKTFLAAAQHGDIDAVKSLFEEQSMWANFAFRSAAIGGQAEVLEFLIEKGQDDYDCAMTLAAEHNQMHIVRLMHEKGARKYSEAMFSPPGYGYVDVTAFLIEQGANNYDESMGKAVWSGREKIVKLLIDNYEFVSGKYRPYEVSDPICGLRLTLADIDMEWNVYPENAQFAGNQDSLKEIYSRVKSSIDASADAQGADEDAKETAALYTTYSLLHRHNDFKGLVKVTAEEILNLSDTSAFDSQFKKHYQATLQFLDEGSKWDLPVKDRTIEVFYR